MNFFNAFSISAMFTLAWPGIAFAQSGSAAPPSDPAAAIRVGSLDVVRSVPQFPWKLLPCVGYNVVINFSNQHYKTRYFFLNLAFPRSKLIVQMKEDPDASLWFQLYDRNLVPIGPPARGGDDQVLIKEDLAPGDYYVQVLTDGSMARLPDGTNRAFVVLRAEPLGYRRPIEITPTRLGNLAPGATVSVDGSVVIKQKRALNFQPVQDNPNCPRGEGPDGLTIDLYNEYVLQSPAGFVMVDVSTRSQQNWPIEYPFKVYHLVTGNLGSDWVEVQNRRIEHKGGELRFRLGHFQTPTILARDAYVDYALTLRLTPTASSPPGVPQVIDLGPPSRSNEVIIGPIGR